MAENNKISVEKRCKQLKVQGRSNKEIQLIIYQEYNQMYALGTIKAYSRVIMDVEKDNSYMEHCKDEYSAKAEVVSNDEQQLEDMWDQAKCRGLLS